VAVHFPIALDVTQEPLAGGRSEALPQVVGAGPNPAGGLADPGRYVWRRTAEGQDHVLGACHGTGAVGDEMTVPVRAYTDGGGPVMGGPGPIRVGELLGEIFAEERAGQEVTRFGGVAASAAPPQQ
jgi:hypothetical protein